LTAPVPSVYAAHCVVLYDQGKPLSITQPETLSHATLHVLLMRLANEFYALPAEALREVMRWRQPTAVPGAPETMPGIIAQRGAVLPVVDLRRLLGLAAAPPGRSTRYVMAHDNGVDLALIVDEVLDLVQLEQDNLQPPPPTLAPMQGRLLRSVARYADKPLAVLSLPAVIVALDGSAT
jgi:purine-binding chemotaxis protein CheW